MQITELSPQAKLACHYCTARLNIFDGSVRSSKTISSLLAWLRFVREGPAGPLLMFGRTERTLRRNIIDPLVEMLGVRRCKLVAGVGELWLLGRKVYLVGANDELAQEKIRGLTLAGAYGDELSTLPESFLSMLITRLSVPGAQFFGTSNPDGPRHWLKLRFLDRARLVLRHGRVVQDRTGEADVIDLHRFRFGLDDNPALTAEYIANLKAELTGLWRRRLIDGEWSIASGVVYDMWDDERHVVDELPELTATLAVGVDYGATNPTHALALALSADGRLVVTREYRHDPQRAARALTLAEVSAELRTWIGGEYDEWGRPSLDIPSMIPVDPSAKALRVQLAHDRVGRVVEADNSVLDGIRTVASLLATDRLVVHSSCRGLLDELPQYAWDDKAAEKGEDRPVKVNDHGADALRYAVQTSQALWRRHLRMPAVGDAAA
ncbi:PBSX family phage terminase large subunit [Actinomycetospora aeridis]|uniref:Terminase n=1 Tax=Actinomycetospora aeridis TaxID=3129231 RepID=A0ABU8N2H9_9PSEU